MIKSNITGRTIKEELMFVLIIAGISTIFATVIVASALNNESKITSSVSEVKVSNDPNLDATTGDTISNAQTQDLTPKGSIALNKRVLWDLTHGVYLGYEPSNYYTSLVSLLGAKGYTVETINNGILNVDLNQYGVLVINLGSSYYSAYSPEEVQAISNYVQNGGGLLVMGDNIGTPNQNINPVAQQFGTTAGVSDLQPDDLYINNFIQHPIFNGVTQFIYRAAGEIDALAPSEEIAWAGNLGALSVVNNYNLGKVVLTGDINFADNTYITQENNQLLSENIFDWLSVPNQVPDISITPAGFNFTLAQGQVATGIMNISNLGYADLNFNITDSEQGPLSIQIPAGKYNDQKGTAASSGVLAAAESSIFTTKEFKAASIPIKVLLVAADDSNTYRTILSGFPDLTVDQFDARSGTPNLTQLQQYDAVIVWSNWGFNDPVALGNVLADYADSGGKIIIQAFSWYGSPYSIDGRIITGGYSPFIREGASIFSTASLGWYDASHPIMAGVNNVTDFYRVNVTLTPGAKLVANWSDNEPFIATKGSVMGINSYPGDYYQWTGDIPLIVHNSLLWLTGQSGAGWLTENPVQGTVPSGGTMPVTLTVNATALNAGNYSAEVTIASNDPDENLVKIPVNLTVIATGGKCYDYDDSLWIAPPAYGDWNVNHRIECNDVAINLNGNLNINGTLSFNNVTLQMNVTTMGEYSINVNSGGQFFVNSRNSFGSVITNGQNTSVFYTFKVRRGSTFQMRNSTVKYAGTGYVLPDYSNDGIWIDTDSVVLDNNTFTVNHFDGVYLNTSDNSRITNNRIYSNSWNGIRGITANNLTITGNEIYSNSWTGIALSTSPNSNLSTNNVHDNLYDGISMGYAPGAVINNNTVTGNHNNGIVLSSASSAVLAGNNASYNLNDGITVSSSPGVNIKSNTVSNNSDVGITLGSSSLSSIFQNTVNNNSEGIYISDSSNVQSDRNTVLNNRWYGVHLYLSHSNNVSRNTINLTRKELASSAVYLSNSSLSTINDNVVYDNLNGIQLWYSPDAYISNNSISQTKGDLKSTSLYLSNSASGKLTANNVSENWEGIVLWESPNAVISSNTLLSNSNNGIKIQNSGDSNIIMNYATSNSGTGIAVISSNNVSVNNNTAIKGGTGISISSSNYGGINNNLASSNGYGISLGSSSHHDMNNNTAEDNSYGISLSSSSFNNVTMSNASRNSFSLYVVWSSNNNNVLGNNFSVSPNYGGYVFKSDYNNISNNNLQKSGTAVHLEESNNNTILLNNATSSTYYGIDLFTSNFNNISRNNARYSSNIGVGLSSSNNNKIEENIAENNNIGVSLRWSNFNTIYNNSARSDFIGIFISQQSGNNRVNANNASGSSNEGIEVSISNDNDIRDNTVAGNKNYGIHAYSSSGNAIQNNTILSNGVGVYLDWSNGNKINKNLIDNNRLNGIALSYVSDNNNVSENSVNENGNISIKVSSSKNNRIENNTATGSDIGIFLDWSGNNIIDKNTAGHNDIHGITLEWFSDNNKIINNNASDNIVGISLMWSSGNILDNNTMQDNNVSTNIEWSSNSNVLVNNTMSSNVYGMTMMWGSTNNTIMNNRIDSNARLGLFLRESSGNTIYNNHIANPDNANDNGVNTWNITKTPGENIVGGSFLGGNFWSDYTGTDLDGDGLGDTLLPYNSKGNISRGGDRRPLILPGPAPTITVYTDKTSYTAGDTMNVGLNITNPGNTRTVGIEVWLDLANGGKYTALNLSSVTLPAGMDWRKYPWMSITLPTMQPGNYAWHAVLKDPVSGNIISESISPWTYVGVAGKGTLEKAIQGASKSIVLAAPPANIG